MHFHFVSTFGELVFSKNLGVQDSFVPHPVTSFHKTTYSLPTFYYLHYVSFKLQYRA